MRTLIDHRIADRRRTVSEAGARRRLRRLLAALVIAALVGFAAWFVYQSPYLAVAEIAVEGQSRSQAAAIVAQAVEGIPSGPLQSKVPRIIKVPAGQAYVRTENPKGEMGYYVISEGGRIPYRVKIRSASFGNLSILPWILEGTLVPDLVAIMGSLDFVLGDVDR